MRWRERIKPANVAERLFFLTVGFFAFFGITNYVGIWEFLTPILSLLFWGYAIWKVCSSIFYRYEISVLTALLNGLGLMVVALFFLILTVLIVSASENELVSWAMFVLLIASGYWASSVYQRRKDDLFVGKLGFEIRDSI